MYVIILGAGRVGLALANLLINDGYDITIIDSNEKLCNNASKELDAMIICGSGTETKTLEDANIDEADVFVASTGNDEINLLSCILAREYGDLKIIARVGNLDHEEAFKRVGIDEVISPERTAASFIERKITRPNVATLVQLGRGSSEILDMRITNDKIVGKTVSEISPNKNFIIISIYTQKGLEIPQPDRVLSRGEKISILVKNDSIEKVEKKIEG